jgi:hypothetical protein
MSEKTGKSSIQSNQRVSVRIFSRRTMTSLTSNEVLQWRHVRRPRIFFSFLYTLLSPYPFPSAPTPHSHSLRMRWTTWIMNSKRDTHSPNKWRDELVSWQRSNRNIAASKAKPSSGLLSFVFPSVPLGSTPPKTCSLFISPYAIWMC